MLYAEALETQGAKIKVDLDFVSCTMALNPNYVHPQCALRMLQ